MASMLFLPCPGPGPTPEVPFMATAAFKLGTKPSIVNARTLTLCAPLVINTLPASPPKLLSTAAKFKASLLWTPKPLSPPVRTNPPSLNIESVSPSKITKEGPKLYSSFLNILRKGTQKENNPKSKPVSKSAASCFDSYGTNISQGSQIAKIILVA